MLKRILLVAASFATLASGVQAQGLLPDRRSVMSQGIDLPGGDLRSLFNTTLEACERACLASSACTAFTFNSRNGSCFPKAQPGPGVAYTGAISGTIAATPAAAQTLANQRRGDIVFLPGYQFDRALDQARALGRTYLAQGLGSDDLRAAALAAEQSGDLQTAAQLYAAAAAAGDSAADWAGFARMTARQAVGAGYQARQQQEIALSAHINAYLRAGPDGLRHDILTSMAQTLERLEDGRRALAAVRMAQKVQPRDDTAATLTRLEGIFGFRVEEHEVQSDLATPRICVRFTEDLAEGGLDYTPFVQLPEPGLTVEPGEWRSLCVAGFAHGQRTSFTLRSGLPAADGQVLTKPVTITAYVRDRAPRAQFAGRAYVLPASGGAAVPVETVNTTRLDLDLYTITDRNLISAMRESYFAQQIEAWQTSDFTSGMAERVWRGQADVEQQINQTVTTRLPLDEALKGRGAGLYALRASVPGADPYASPAAWQWFVVSDLGLTTFSGADGLHVVARSLADASAKPGARVELLSRSNRVLGTAQTDAQGIARFDAALALGTGGAQPALVVVSQGEDDIAFLSLADPAFDLSDRGVAGRAAPPPIDVFLTTDRGAYRAGETIFATALARDGQAQAIAGLPMTAVLKRPDGVEYSRSRIDDQLGGYVFALPVAATAPRGAWRIEVLADTEAAPLASAQVLVEDFLPERIDFDLSLPDTPLALGDAPRLDLAARYLFGAPGAGLAGEGDVVLRAAKGLEAWPGYRFGRADQPFDTRLESISPFTTDDSGAASVLAALPNITDPGQPLEAVLRLRLAEGSGRPVERSLTRALEPAGVMIGIKPGFADVLPENSTAEFDVIALQASGLVDVPVKWRLDRIETRYQWFSLQGRWNWEPVTTRVRLAEGTAQTGTAPVPLSMPVQWGEFELTLERDAGPFVATSVRFSAGWYAPADAARSPDTLELSLDKPAYRAGDTAILRIVPRAAGTALVSVLSDRVVHMQAVEVAEGENLVPLAVTDDWGAGAYVMASVLRPMDVAAGRNPARAMGLAHASVDPGARKLDVALDAPAESDPRAPLTATLRVTGVATGERAYATVAAVDQGILNLTAYQPPDPSAHYFGQRRLGVGLRDLYGRLIDGMNGAAGIVRSGGDAGLAARLQAPPPTEELLAYFTGPVEIGPDGTAQVSFDMPGFNGSVRLMAVVWSQGAVGQADTQVLVRDPVVVSASLPRFMAPGDDSRLLLEITHASGPTGRMGLDVTAQGITLGTVASGVDLTEGGKAVLEVPVRANADGLAEISVALTTPEGRVLRKTLALPVQTNDPEIARTTQVDLAPGQELTLGDDVLAGLHLGTARATVSAGAAARFNSAGLLAALDAYPYGCSEQITSRALPLLSVAPMAREMGLAGADTIGTRIDQTLAQLLLNQTTEGGFGLWSAAQGGDLWLDAYVTDFMSRARAQGHAVPQTAMRAALDNLRNRVNYAGDFESGGGDLAYALLVLAREGAAAVGDLRYYADVKSQSFSTPMGLAQLGAALAMYGDQPRADALMARASALALAAREDGQIWRDDFGTVVRDRAAVLALASEVGSTAINRAGLIDALAGRPADPLSTQEAAWMLMASAFAGRDGLTVNEEAPDGPLGRMLRPGDRPLVLRNTGAMAQPVLVTSYGVAQVPEPEGGNGYAIARRYYTLEGQAADPAMVKAGTRLVAVLEITPFDAGEARLMVADPLPAGFEIDNPALLDSARLTGLEWLEVETDVTHSEFRQDRFLTAIDRQSGDAFRLAYMLRAVSPGSYHHPAASVEDMYRPAYRAQTGAGRVTVTP